jgi:hypothetical protein
MVSAESRIEDHENRLWALERNIASLSQAQADTLKTSQATHRLVTTLVPEVLALKKQSRAVQVAKRTGGAGLLLALGGILESYGPDIIRLILGR